MKTLKLHKREIFGVIGLFALLQMGLAKQAMSEESCANIVSGSPSSQSGTNNPSCSSYSECIGLGQQLLQRGDSAQAVIAFEQASKVNGLDDRKKSIAYGCMGVAYDSVPDKVMAEQYLKKASVISGQSISWIEKEYKHLLVSQPVVKQEFIERALQPNNEIEEMENTPKTQENAPTGGSSVNQDTADAADAGIPPKDLSLTAPGVVVRGVSAGPVTTEKPKEKTVIASLQRSDDNPKVANLTKPKRAEKPHVYIPPTTVAKRHPSEVPSLDLRINFELDSANLTSEGKAQADELGKALQKIFQKDGNQHAVLVGHTDIKGGEEYNNQLSENRAAAVKAYLSKIYPDLADKLSERGMGKQQPLYRDMDDVSQQLNRRVEVKLSRSAE
ncbi:MAG: OmpA family protein [Proteobacteria bacterium]|nr:OmpA family protein [Pseudomonadota bacterium]